MSGSNLTEKKRRQLFGEAVCGFARVQTTKEANHAILTGIQQTEKDFSSSFVEEAKKVFPSGENIISSDAPLREQREEISSLEDKVLSSLGKELGIDIEHVRCNQQEQSFELGPKYLKKLSPTERAIVLETEWYIKESLFSPIEEPMDYSDLEHIYKMAQDGTIKVFALEPSFLETLEDESLINDIILLNKLWTSYNTIIFYKGIKRHQEKVRKFLSWLNHPTATHPTATQQEHHLLFVECLKIYNEMPKYSFETDQQGNLRKHYQIREEDYLSINLPLKWLDRIKSDLAYCLIEFLILGGNREHIYTCDKCKGFYCPKILHTRDHYFCSDKCRGKHHSEKPEYKEKKAAAQREKYGWEKREKKAAAQNKK
jgi:hypothetical protein